MPEHWSKRYINHQIQPSIHMIRPEIEQDIGILVYATSTPGLNGIIKQVPEDFVVKEITNREEKMTGKYLICTLSKKNWDTHHLIRELSRILRISQKRLDWAGTKDKNALTTQKISIYDMDESQLERIRLKDVTITPIGRSDNKVSLGDLWGNTFKVIIRGINRPLEDVKRLMDQTSSQISDMKGVPNFFGIQRFGTQRPITHLVGRKLVEGDLEGAALLYIARPCPGESTDAKEARLYVQETHDFKGGLERYPLRLRFERAMMNHLVQRPGDYAGAFRALSPNLRKMFLHAYQSYLFNLILSRRLIADISLNHAQEGDLVCFKNAVGLPDPTKLQPVTIDTLDGINNLMEKGRAFITAPLIGYDTLVAEEVPGEIERTVLAGLDVEGFGMRALPELASKGLRREIIIPVKPTYNVCMDTLISGCTAIELEFMLQRGAYATTVLREYMKNIPSVNIDNN